MANKLVAWTAERGLTFRNRRKRNEEPIETMMRNKIIPSKKSTRQQIKLKGTY